VRIAFSTSQVHQRDRFDYWHDVACRKLVEHDSRPECRISFEAEIEIGELGTLNLVQFRNSPMRVNHTQGHAIKARSDELLVCRQMLGDLVLEQEGRTASLSAGDLSLLDPLLPYEAGFGHDSRTLVLKIPRRELEARVGKTRDMVAYAIKPVGAEDHLSSSISAMLPSLTGKLLGSNAEMVSNHVIDLIAVSIGRSTLDARPRVSCTKAFFYSKIRAAVDARLSDRDLDAQTVADAVGVSIRYANEILSEYDTSIGRLILARRLARCRRAIEDPEQAHRSISEIAYGWGFSDLTHFGRTFKKAYGILPRDVKKVAKKQERGCQGLHSRTDPSPN